MTMKVRSFKAEDQQAVKKLITSILDQEFQLERKAYSDTDLNMISETYSGSRNTFLVGEVNQKIIGTVAIKEDDRETALLRRLFIDPAHRGKQYGSQLVDEALTFCRKQGYKKVVFRGSASMSAALALGRKKGFAEVERLPFGPVEMIHLVLQL